MKENTFKHLHFREYYTMFENNLIKINFVENCKIYINLPTSPIFEVPVVSWQKEQKLR